MPNLTIWDPTTEFPSLRSAMDRLFDQTWTRPWGSYYGNGSAQTSTFALDLFEDGDEYRLTAVLPGIKPEDVDVSVQGNVLTITAERKPIEAPKDATWYVHEVSSGQYSRQLALPAAVDADGVEARVENGFLYLRLPKVAAARAHKIQISDGSTPRILEHSPN